MLALVGWVISSGCTDRIPTLTDIDEIVGGAPPLTLEQNLATGEFLQSTTVITGSAISTQSTGLIVARDFDEVFNAHLLARFNSFPDTITVNGERDGAFLYLNSEVVATVPDSLELSAPRVDFYLWTVTQPWEEGEVSWENAAEGPGQNVPWLEPGGTRGEIIGIASWERGATGAAADSLKWDLPAAVLTRLAEGELPGLMVTLEDQNARAVISRLAIRASINPSVAPDTTITQTITAGPQTFIFTPEPPAPVDVLSAGGIRADRTLLSLVFPDSLPGCAEDEVPACPPVSTAEVILNRVELILDPLPVAEGFGPVAPIPLTLRRVLQPELGELAPLGEPIVFQMRVPAERFGPGATTPVRIPITQAVANTFDMKRNDLTVALLVEPQSATFAFAWFERNPRLRFIYTLPQVPALP